MAKGIRTIAKKAEAKREHLPPKARKAEESRSMDYRVDQVLFLQRTIGNQAVQRLLKGGIIQAKLKVGQPGDIYEQEADRLAEQVMKMAGAPVQRQPQEEEKKREEEETIHTKPMAAQITPLVQRQPEEEEEKEEELQMKASAGQTPQIGPDVESRINAMKGGGQPLPISTRAFFEPRFGCDFSRIRVHTDSKAAGSARAVNALAYTVGKDVVFGAGQYTPETEAGKRLMAHELTHVVQQESGRQLPYIQRVTIPGTASLADFVNWTQLAIDDIAPGSPLTLGREGLIIAQGLRNHITLRSGNAVTPGGVFFLPAGTFGLSAPVSFELIVDDLADPPLAGTFTPPSTSGGACTITLYARRFRGGDHSILGSALFHEIVHALFHLRRTYPAMSLRPVAEQVLSASAGRDLRNAVRREVDDLIAARPEAERDNMARRLSDEVFVIVETEAYQVSITRVPGPGMTRAEFGGHLDRMLFRGTLFLSRDDRRAIMADPLRRRALELLSDILYGFYGVYRFRRLARIGVSQTGFRVTGRPQPRLWTPPPLTPPVFAPLPLPSP